jgi:hypothetical protein
MSSASPQTPRRRAGPWQACLALHGGEPVCDAATPEWVRVPIELAQRIAAGAKIDPCIFAMEHYGPGIQ